MAAAPAIDSSVEFISLSECTDYHPSHSTHPTSHLSLPWLSSLDVSGSRPRRPAGPGQVGKMSRSPQHPPHVPWPQMSSKTPKSTPPPSTEDLVRRLVEQEVAKVSERRSGEQQVPQAQKSQAEAPNNGDNLHDGMFSSTSYYWPQFSCTPQLQGCSDCIRAASWSSKLQTMLSRYHERNMSDSLFIYWTRLSITSCRDCSR